MMRNKTHGTHRDYNHIHNHTAHSINHNHHHYYGGGIAGSGFNHHGGHHYRGAKNVGAAYERISDLVFNNSQPPSIIKGRYYFTGNEKSFRAQINSILPSQQNTVENLIQQKDEQLLKVSLDLVGNKTKTSNECCYCTTIIFASFLVFPLCFMCCLCWKKIVYPMYELPIETYKDIDNFLRRFPNLDRLQLRVIDNAFNAQKARIVSEILSKSKITFFSFSNGALDCNGQFNEADDFRNNMLPIKSLNITSQIRWGDMIM